MRPSSSRAIFSSVSVVAADALDALSQRVVFFLQQEIFLLQLFFLRAQAPQMKHAALAERRKKGERDKQTREEVDDPAAG